MNNISNLIFSMNPSTQTKQMEGAIEGDLTDIIDQVVSFIGLIKGVVSNIFEVAFGSYQEAKEVDFSTLKTRDIKVVPTVVEKKFGEIVALSS